MGKRENTFYFLDLKELWKRTIDLDFDSKESLKQFADELDYEDKCVIAKTNDDPDSLLESDELLWTTYLADKDKFRDARSCYLKLYPDDPNREKFINLVEDFFGIGKEGHRIVVPIIQLDSQMDLGAITTVFATLNTTGQPLTAVEIVTAILSAHNINLREKLEIFRSDNTYYPNIDPTGEMLLQTIALLDGKSSKKRDLPKLIKPDVFAAHEKDSVHALELAGKFLSDRFGMALDVNRALVPYPAMLPPLGIALTEIERLYSSMSEERPKWHGELVRWFVGSVFEQRYKDSQPATQYSDTNTLKKWITEGTEPEWMAEVKIPALHDVPPKSAIGKMITCLINRQAPQDPMSGKPVGGKGTNITSVHSHHIFPKDFCVKDIDDWGERDDYNLALNVMPITRETNQEWSKLNPTEHVRRVRQQRPSEDINEIYAPFFVDKSCLSIMEKEAKKTREDFYTFIRKREELVHLHVATKWGFIADSQQQVEDNEEIEND